MFHRKSKVKKARAAAQTRGHRAGRAGAKARGKAAANVKQGSNSLQHTTASLLGTLRGKYRPLPQTRAQRASNAAAKAHDRAATNVKHSARTLQHNSQSLIDSFKDKAGPMAGTAAATASGAAATAAAAAGTARDRAVAGLDHGIDRAVPRGQEAVTGVGPKVDHVRDVIVEDLLPKLSELLGSVQSAKNDLLAKPGGPVAAVTGAPRKRSRKGGVLIVIGVLSAIGAGIAYYLNQQSKPKTDPWAGTAERPIGGAPGVDTQVRSRLGSDVTTDDLGTTSGATTSGATTGGVAAGGVAAGDIGTSGAAETGGGAAADAPAEAVSTDAPATPLNDGTSEPVDADAGDVHILDGEEIDALAADTPPPADESDIPGINTDATTGLGTDSTIDRDTREGDTGQIGGTPRP